jgi:orotate phosphoribosyltransferase
MTEPRLGDAEIVEILTQTGAIKHGHFVLTSGRHSDTYIQCAQVMESPELTMKLAREAVARLPHEVREAVDVVAAPAVGGITYGFAVALALGVNFIFSERVQGKMHFRRSFHIEPGQNVLVCEDVVTTGGSVAEVIELVREAGGNVVGVTSIIDRKTARKFSEPFYPLLEFPTQSWAPEECELCANGGEPQSLGSRALAK